MMWRLLDRHTQCCYCLPHLSGMNAAAMLAKRPWFQWFAVLLIAPAPPSPCEGQCVLAMTSCWARTLIIPAAAGWAGCRGPGGWM